MLWLGLIAKNFYRNNLGFLMRPSPNWIAAIIFYLVYIAAIMFFVVHPAMAKDSWRYALFVGFIFGFITYMTYDFTNLATLKDWPLNVTIIDTLWGTFLGGLTSFLSFSIIKILG